MSRYSVNNLNYSNLLKRGSLLSRASNSLFAHTSLIGGSSWIDCTTKFRANCFSVIPTSMPRNGSLGCASYNGVNSFSDLGILPILDNIQKCTISFWAMTYAGNTDYSGILGLYNSSFPNNNVIFAIGGLGEGDTTSFSMDLRASGNTYSFSNTGVIPVGIPKHAIWVFDGTQSTNSGKVTLYVNGVQQNLSFNGTIPNSFPPNNGIPWRVGTYGSLGSRFFKGLVDEILFFPNLLFSPYQALYLYNQSRNFHPDGWNRNFIPRLLARASNKAFLTSARATSFDNVFFLNGSGLG